MNTFEKEEILANANILLVSDHNEDYKALQEYGFKNIDHIPSVVLGSKCFSQHKDELKQYDIALLGETNVDRAAFIGWAPYSESIKEALLSIENIYISKFFHSYTDQTITTHTYKTTHYPNMESYLDAVLNDAIVYGHGKQLIAKKAHKKLIPYKPAKEQDLPTCLNDIKVLALVNSLNTYTIADYLKKAGVTNVTVLEDCNPALQNHVIEHLGEYDIILSTELYSSMLLNLTTEAQEQAKASGKKLVMLATYEYQGLFSNKDITTKYIFISPNEDKFTHGTINYNLFSENCYVDIAPSTVEITISKYIEYLNSISDKKIASGSLKSATDYNNEYNKEIEKIQEEKRKLVLEREALGLDDFDILEYTITRYLKLKSKGLISKNPEGLKIETVNGHKKVTFIRDQIPLCSITFPKSNVVGEDIRLFTLETVSKNGRMSTPVSVGLYTSAYDKRTDLPRKPTEKELNSLKAIEKRVSYYVEPLITAKAINEAKKNQKNYQYSKKRKPSNK